MQIGQHRARPIPFWRNFVYTCCVLALPSCSDPSGDAAESAYLAQQALDANNLAAARIAIIEAIAERDDVVDYHLLRGRIELELGSQSAAYNAFSDALSLDATNGQALMAVAQLGLTTGHLRESLEATEQILTLAPDNVDALLIRGIHSIVKRDYQEAIEYGDKVLVNAPGHEGGTILKARALFMLGKPQEALATLNDISADAEGSAGAVQTRLEIYRALQQPEQMAAEFRTLRRLRPDDLAVKADEANLRFKMGNRPQAHALVGDILADPDADLTAADVAVGLWAEYGSDDVPRQYIARIGRSGSVPARQALSRFLLRQGRVGEADDVISGLPEASNAGLKARYLVLAKDPARALQLAQSVLERDATDCDALIAASEASLARQSPDVALRYAQQASAECPTQPGGWTASAKAYRDLDRGSGVNRVYVQALEANKQSRELTQEYTQWLVSEGRGREAVAMARRLTRYAPALISGWRLYASLCRTHQTGCVSEADAGLSTAQSIYGIDLAPGTPPPNGLFGRLVER